MIYKTYELQKNLINILKCNMLLLYGENFGVKKEIKETIIINKRKKNNNIEVNSLYENDVTENEENFYESIYSGSLFSNEKIIIINNCTDKINKKI